MINYFQPLLKVLNSNRTPVELAHAFASGMLLAFLPKGNLLWILLFVVALFLRINRGTLFISIIFGSVFAPLLDGCFDAIGYTILVHPALIHAFSNFMEIPFVAFTRFNNTIVMGALALGLILYIPLYMIAKVFIRIWYNTISSHNLGGKA